MRWLLLILIIYSTEIVQAQVNKTWTGDTARVAASIYLGDTTYYVRSPYKSGEWLIFYDSTFHNEAAHHIFFKRDYTYTDWYRNGQIKSSWTSKDSITHGCYDCKRWYRSGSVMVEMNCNGDSSIQITYYESGAVKKILKASRDRQTRWMVDHLVTEYYENGQLKYDPADVNGPRQTGKNYYESGKVSREATWQAGALIGPYTEWYENGKVKVEGQYVMPPNETAYTGTKQTGKWSYYSESGKLIKEEFYEEGKLVKTIEY